MGLIDKPKIWDIYKVQIFFEDSMQSKIRPALLVKENELVFLSFKITSNTKRKGIDEYTVINWKQAGLEKESNIRISKLIQFDKKLLIEKIGVLPFEDRIRLLKQAEDFLNIYNATFTNSLIKNLKNRINDNI